MLGCVAGLALLTAFAVGQFTMRAVRIFFIPLDAFELDSNRSVANRIRLLCRRNELVGVVRRDYFVAGFPGARVYARFLWYALRVLVYALGNRRQFDLIYCCDEWSAAVGALASVLAGRPLVRDCPSVPDEWLGRVQAPWPLALATRLADCFARRKACRHIVLSEADRTAFLAKGLRQEHVVVVPRPADLSLADAVVAGKQDLRSKLGLGGTDVVLIFTGPRTYAPNLEAARWINHELAPAVCSTGVGVRIVLTGDGPIPENAHPILHFTGFVPDLFEYLHAADALIAPIPIPSGRLTKVFDALSCAVPVVVLESARNGIPELVDGHNAVVARNRQEFVDKTVRLLTDPHRRESIGRNGRLLLEEHYGWSMLEQRLDSVLAECISLT
jgi:glycosyltransferase involved in cell wall biosynthesis